MNDKNPNWDIRVNKDKLSTYVECKLDTMSEKTNNLYFEYWNFTYNRPTGINNKDLSTLYSHTFKLNNEWYYIVNYRKQFIKTLLSIIKNEPSKIRPYNNTYYIHSKLVGDKAYIVDVDTFFKYYKAKTYKMNLLLRWY